MRKRIIITILVCGALAIAVAVGITVASRDSGDRPDPVQSVPPSVVPSTSPSPLEATVYEENIEDAEEKNPVVAQVPKQTPYWRAELLGSGRQDGKIVIDVTVYVKPGQDKQRAIERQRPYVERWLKGIGQRAGTYVLKIGTEAPHVY